MKQRNILFKIISAALIITFTFQQASFAYPAYKNLAPNPGIHGADEENILAQFIIKKITKHSNPENRDYLSDDDLLILLRHLIGAREEYRDIAQGVRMPEAGVFEVVLPGKDNSFFVDRTGRLLTDREGYTVDSHQVAQDEQIASAEHITRDDAIQGAVGASSSRLARRSPEDVPPMVAFIEQGGGRAIETPGTWAHLHYRALPPYPEEGRSPQGEAAGTRGDRSVRTPSALAGQGVSFEIAKARAITNDFASRRHLRKLERLHASRESEIIDEANEIVIPEEYILPEFRGAITKAASMSKDLTVVPLAQIQEMVLKEEGADRRVVLLTEDDLDLVKGMPVGCRVLALSNYNFLHLAAAIDLARAVATGNPQLIELFYSLLLHEGMTGMDRERMGVVKGIILLALPSISEGSIKDIDKLREEYAKFIISA